MSKKWKVSSIFLAAAMFASGCDRDVDNNANYSVIHEHSKLLEVTGDISFEQAIQRWKDTYDSDIDFYNAARNYFNCYAYAAGSVGSPYITDLNSRQFAMHAIPGSLAGKPMKLFTPEELNAAVIADGFERVEGDFSNHAVAEPPHRDGYLLVAAFLDSSMEDIGLGFHFAVRDDEGRWTQKHSNLPIDEKRGENDFPSPHVDSSPYLGDYYKFIGYYWRPEAGINVTAAQDHTIVGSFDKITGKYVGNGLFDPATMRSDIWVGMGSDYLVYNHPIDSLKFERDNDGNGILIINDIDTIQLNPGLLFERDGIGHIDIMDINGVSYAIVIDKKGHLDYTTNKSLKTGNPSPNPFLSFR